MAKNIYSMFTILFFLGTLSLNIKAAGGNISVLPDIQLQDLKTVAIDVNTPTTGDYRYLQGAGATKEKLEENIEFLGGVSQDVLADLYRRCGLFVFPSSVETFGNPLVEAMASGAPIACSGSAAMPEVAGDAAIYFDPRNPDEMAKAIARLMSEQDLCKTLSKKAVSRAREFTWEKTAKKTLAVLMSAAVPPSSGNSN